VRAFLQRRLSIPAIAWLALLTAVLRGAANPADGPAGRDMGATPFYARLRHAGDHPATPLEAVVRIQDAARLRVTLTGDALVVQERQAEAWLERAHLPVDDPTQSIYIARRPRALFIYHESQPVFALRSLTADNTIRLETGPNRDAVALHAHPLPDIRMTDDFMRRQIGIDDAWTRQSGWWRTSFNARVQSSPNPFTCCGSADDFEDGLLLTGQVFWNEVALSVALHPDDTAASGLVFGYREADDYWLAVISPGNPAHMQIIRQQGGNRRVVAQAPIRYPNQRWIRLTVLLEEGGQLVGMLDQTALCVVRNADSTYGKVGLTVRGGTVTFDDFEAVSLPSETQPQLPPVSTRSRIIHDVPRITQEAYKAANREILQWADDHEFWRAGQAQNDSKILPGRRCALPLYGDFSLSVPASGTERLVQVEDHAGRALHSLFAGQRAALRLHRRGTQLLANDLPVGEPVTAQAVTLFVGDPGGSAATRSAWLPEANVELRSALLRCDLFESAPVDWLPIAGQWHNSNRWQCDPRWSYFSGVAAEDAVLISKGAFQGDQVHEVYFALKDVLGRHYELRRYVRRDVGFSFCTDGRDLFSGYTVIVGGFNNSGSYLYRGREQIAANRAIRFKEFSGRSSIYDEHLLWRRLRVERRMGRLRVFYEQDVLFDVAEDPDQAPAGGHLALWTCRNGIMIGRLNSAAEAILPPAATLIRAAAVTAPPPGGWQPLEPDRVELRANRRLGSTAVHNRFGGGTFAVEWPMLGASEIIDLSQQPSLRLWLDIPESVKVSLHIRVNGRNFIYPITAPLEATYRHLCDEHAVPADAALDWRAFTTEPLADSVFIGTPRPAFRGVFTANVYADVKQYFPDAAELALDRIVIGNSSQTNYLMCGLSGNRAGASYAVGNLPR